MRYFTIHSVLTVLVASLLAGGQASGESSVEGANREALDHFEQHIRPLLIEHCVRCHGQDKQESGLRLDSRKAIMTGGDSGPAINEDAFAESLLLSAVRHESFEMPPSGKLPDRLISNLEEWVAQGAPWPENSVLEIAESKPREITNEDRAHWSFQPIRRPAIPEFGLRASQEPYSSFQDWPRNAIDRFVLRRLIDSNLLPAPEADPRTLVRRVYLDILGVPPTPNETKDFLADTSDKAYERLVDNLLSRPEYGERWARHWLDLVRYAESDGFRQDAYRDGAWRYRDYVIRSFNDDKPYERFIAEQLAGDELYPDDPSSWIGTAYFRLQPYEYNQRDIVTQRQDILNDITDVTADVFLGVGMKCARCHDHKFDPILQTDYFQLQAHFAALLPVDNKPLLTNLEKASYDAQLKRWELATAKIRAKIEAVHKPYKEKQAKTALAKFTPELRAMFEKPPAEREPLESQLAYFIRRQTVEEGKYKLKDTDAKTVKALEEELGAFDHLKPARPGVTLVSTDVANVAPETTFGGKETPVQPAGMSVLRHLVPNATASRTENYTGRRSALVAWLTSPTHPLTSRVAVNRIWQHHFGQGIVPTSNDFGKLGSTPSHPELLDWLASNFMEEGWRFKRLHRMIVCSSTYRQSATHPDAQHQERVDPSNQYCWRAPVRRMDAEQLIDTTLSVSGQLIQRVGGPGQDSKTRRRAIYRKVLRNKPDKLIGLFDGADLFNSTPQRGVTTTSPQALALLNGEFGNKHARAMAARIQDDADSIHGQIHTAYALVFCREPSDHEVKLAMKFMDYHDGWNGEESLVGLTKFCHALLNSNEFFYID